jgi:uroporphyrinogen decarboxylase
VACYLIEGKANRQFGEIKNWLYRDAADLAKALDLLADATVKYLKDQHAHGAHAVQLFDTWLAEMPRGFFVEHYRGMLNRIFGALRQAGIPTIYFTKNAYHLVSDFSGLTMDVLSCDSLLTLTEMETHTQRKFSLQGNLDPVMLFGDTGVVRRETRKLVAEARKLSRPAILNLGHGILPKTPVENVQAFVQEARQLWI